MDQNRDAFLNDLVEPPGFDQPNVALAALGLSGAVVWGQGGARRITSKAVKPPMAWAIRWNRGGAASIKRIAMPAMVSSCVWSAWIRSQAGASAVI
jgi:hypothetical protein